MKGWKKCKVRDICDLGRGREISGQETEHNPGVFPVYSSQSYNNGKMGAIDTFDFSGEYVTSLVPDSKKSKSYQTVAR
jgi:restriction endonuclease S subunit